MNQLSEILKELKKIQPHPHFTHTSRMRVLSTPRIATPVREFTWATSLFNRLSSPSAVLASFVAVMILSSALFIQHKTTPYLAVIRMSDDKEKEELAIRINLSEVVSYEEAKQMIQVALLAAAQQTQKQ